MTGLAVAGAALVVLAAVSSLALLWVVMDRAPATHQAVPYARHVATGAALWLLVGVVLLVAA